MSDLSETRQFTISNGKVKILGCPYEGDAEVVELTATEYMRQRHCQCMYCWKRGRMDFDVVGITAWRWVVER